MPQLGLAHGSRMLEFNCPRCNQRLRVADSVAGRLVKCPLCATLLDAPHMADSSLGDEKTQPPSAVASLPQVPAPPSTLDPDIARLLARPEQPDEIGRLGPYRVRKLLGIGGMGVVFEAEDVQLQRPV